MLWVEHCVDLERGNWLILQSAEINVCTVIAFLLWPLLPQWECAVVIMWTPLLVLNVCCYTAFAMLFFLLSLAVSLCFLSLSDLHTCKARECGSLRDDSSVAHLIVAWPYLGFPEIHFSGVAERSRQCRDNMMSSFLLSFFFCTVFQSMVL